MLLTMASQNATSNCGGAGLPGIFLVHDTIAGQQCHKTYCENQSGTQLLLLLTGWRGGGGGEDKEEETEWDRQE